MNNLFENCNLKCKFDNFQKGLYGIWQLKLMKFV